MKIKRVSSSHIRAITGAMKAWIFAIAMLICGPALSQTNPGCSSGGNTILVCSMPTTPGTYTYQVDGITHTSVELTNNTSAYLQINSVGESGSFPNEFGDMCVFRNVFATSQTVPGAGEVGCSYMATTDGSRPPVLWHNPNDPNSQTALAVMPGDSIYIQSGHQTNGGTEYYDGTYQVTIAAATSDVFPWRAPRADHSIPCDNTQQQTTWGPWQNNSGNTIYYQGATIYANSPGSKSVNAACIYTLDTNGTTVLASRCTGTTTAGQVSFSPMSVAPGQYIEGQANNMCSSGLWDWAGYIWVYGYNP